MPNAATTLHSVCLRPVGRGTGGLWQFWRLMILWQGLNSWTGSPHSLSTVLWAIATLAYPWTEHVRQLWHCLSHKSVSSAVWSAVNLRRLFVAFLVTTMRHPELTSQLEAILQPSGLLSKMRAIGLTAALGALGTRRDVSSTLARMGIKHSIHHSLNIGPGALCVIDIKLAAQPEIHKLLAAHNRQLVH